MIPKQQAGRASEKFIDSDLKISEEFTTCKMGCASLIIQNTLYKLCEKIKDKDVCLKNILRVVLEDTITRIYLKSSNIIIHKNGQQLEEFIQIHFTLYQNTKILIYVTGNNLNLNNKTMYCSLDIIYEPSTITEQKVTDLVYDGFKLFCKNPYTHGLTEKLQEKLKIEFVG